jgi:acyl-CoA synthetase (AMP-forming)/AMP-acid ligase II
VIWSQFISRAEATPRKKAVLFGDSGVTYAELVSIAVALADRLPDVSSESPRRVFVRQREPFSALAHVLACWKRGFVPVVLREGTTDRQVADFAAWLRPVAVLSDPVSSCWRPVLSPAPHAGSILDARREALVICTSGTTGAPKFVALPAESVCINADVIGRALGLEPEDNVAVNTPLGYLYGLIGGCVASLWAGATCCLFSPRDPFTQLQAAIRLRGITVVQGPPTLFRFFMAYWNGKPFPSVRVLTTGGEPLQKDLAEALGAAFPNARRLFLYGMTEAGPRISHETFEAGGGADGCAGRIYSHFEWRVDPVEEEPEVSGGRLILRGPSMLLGYIAADGSYNGLDEAGFFHSSDLVSLDATGRLYFRGRLDRMFKSGGKMVNPEAVERVISLHTAVDNAYCFAERHSILGLTPAVEIVPKGGVVADPADILRLASAHLEPHAVPRRIIIVSHPKLADSGKRHHGD